MQPGGGSLHGVLSLQKISDSGATRFKGRQNANKTYTLAMGSPSFHLRAGCTQRTVSRSRTRLHKEVHGRKMTRVKISTAFKACLWRDFALPEIFCVCAHAPVVTGHHFPPRRRQRKNGHRRHRRPRSRWRRWWPWDNSSDLAAAFAHQNCDCTAKISTVDRRFDCHRCIVG